MSEPITNNQQYGAFYAGYTDHELRLDSKEIADELARNDRIRLERKSLPSIAYEIRFDVGAQLWQYIESRMISIALETRSAVVEQRYEWE
jgi:hypothetical protein